MCATMGKKWMRRKWRRDQIWKNFTHFETTKKLNNEEEKSLGCTVNIDFVPLCCLPLCSVNIFDPNILESFGTLVFDLLERMDDGTAPPIERFGIDGFDSDFTDCWFPMANSFVFYYFLIHTCTNFTFVVKFSYFYHFIISLHYIF